MKGFEARIVVAFMTFAVCLAGIPAAVQGNGARAVRSRLSDTLHVAADRV